MAFTPVTESDFTANVLHSAEPVIVDFSAEWCHPCKQLDPVLEELADFWQGKVRVYSVDSDKEVNLVTRYGVMGLPTLILFIHGEPRERLTGFKPRKKIEAQFGRYL